LYARDLDWGYAAPSLGTPVAHDRDLLADRLSAELGRSFLYLKQYWEQDVSQVLLCGDMPEIRSLTAPLIDRLNIEVETLDTLDGIDTATVPAGFAERAPMLRLASSIAAEPPPVNLLPVEVTAIRTNRTGQRIVALGSAAAVVIGAFLYGQATVNRIDAEQQLDDVRRETASLKAGVVAAKTAGAAGDAENVLRAALNAMDTQGPAMARVLEAVGNAAPPSVTVRSLHVTPDDAYWTVTLDAISAGADQTVARQAADAFLRALDASPTFDERVRAPTRRFVRGAGIEIAAAYRVRK
jgi:hypothetical protein